MIVLYPPSESIEIPEREINLFCLCPILRSLSQFEIMSFIICNTYYYCGPKVHPPAGTVKNVFYLVTVLSVYNPGYRYTPFRSITVFYNQLQSSLLVKLGDTQNL